MNPTRIQRQRTKGWSKPPRCMIVDRTSHFGNPFTIDQFIALGHQEPEARTMAVAQFRQWLHGSRAAWTSNDSDRRREKLLTRLPELRGMDLACPCGPGEPCHGDILLEWAALSHLALEVRTAATRARVDHQRTAHGLDPIHDADDLAAVLTQEIHLDLGGTVDVDPGDGIPQRCDSKTWNHHLRRRRLLREPVTHRLVEVFG
ncbi:DUF4326 domain-containing protein [Streptomyces albidoflavus]|uniref:DUF4326 domain-containing protein n=1 Tax=Streptomyces albidoflavus TaxID=1886 RepID=UPI002F90D46D|nr:DUF4326 domain-containing protein [Streptomyces albidoflavus]WSD57045.1 DUF4326 domain-containing protein [Streptomyces albidoflavus]WTE00925.1 DUF4326 domain-containing protein [Streptomyces albidoflavus]